jgi:hypothetical protein
MGMIMRSATSLAFVAACLTSIAAAPAAEAQYAGAIPVTNGPQTNPGDFSPSWSARQNVIESRNYDRLLETNPAFRQGRMQKECGPISDPRLHARCLASFNRDEPDADSPAPVPRGQQREAR